MFAAYSNGSDNSFIKVPKGNYGVLIGGVEITSKNYQNINSTNFPAVKSGKVTYDPIKRILTLDNTTIEATGKEVPIIYQLESVTATLTIVLRNTNKLSSEEYSGIATEEASLYITGGGFLSIDVNPESVGIGTGENLIIEGGCTIKTNGQINVFNQLTINKANIYIKSGKDTPALVGYKGITLKNCEVVFPKKFTLEYWNDYYYTFAKKDKTCKEIKIIAN